MRGQGKLRAAGTIGVAVAAMLTVSVAPAGAATPGITVIAEGLNGPFGLGFGSKKLYVAEAEAGQITEVNPKNGKKVVVASGLASPSGVDREGNKLYIVTGGSDVPDAPTAGTASLLVQTIGSAPTVLADLLAYELANNPDGQLQFDPVTHEPLDTLSNPFAVLAQEKGGPGVAFVADGGANAVLSVKGNGDVSTFFVPPVINTGACAGRPNNDAQHTGCDQVPTGLAYGPGNETLYVTTLNGEAPGEGRVYVLNAKTGAVLNVLSGFTAPTGIAVSRTLGTIWVSEVLEGAPQGDGPPPPGFNPADIGQIVRVEKNGTRSYAQVTMPVGMYYENGKLYSTAWAIAGFLGIQNAGQIVSVAPSAFKSA